MNIKIIIVNIYIYIFINSLNICNRKKNDIEKRYFYFEQEFYKDLLRYLEKAILDIESEIKLIFDLYRNFLSIISINIFDSEVT